MKAVSNTVGLLMILWACGWFAPAPAPVPTVPVVPAVVVWGTVIPVIAAAASTLSEAERVEYADLYSSLAIALKQDASKVGRIDTTEKLREANATALDVFVEKSKVGLRPELGRSIDAHFTSVLGTDVKRLDVDAAVKACSDIAWTFTHGR
jgi:hypothetical protein